MAIHKNLQDAELHENKGVASASDFSVLQASSGASLWTTTPVVAGITATSISKQSARSTVVPTTVLDLDYDSIDKMEKIVPSTDGLATNAYSAIDNFDSALVCKATPFNVDSESTGSLIVPYSYTETSVSYVAKFIIKAFATKFVEGAATTVEGAETEQTVTLTENTDANGFKTFTATVDVDGLIASNRNIYFVIIRDISGGEDLYAGEVLIGDPIFVYQQDKVLV